MPEIKKKIMGIDPGTNRMGYGVLEVNGNKLSCIVLGVIELGKMNDPYEKLRYIFERVSDLIKEYDPDEVALESPFFGENVQSMLKLGRAQGVAMAAALHLKRNVFEYAPRRIKQSITGTGSAAKEQVAIMLKKLLGVDYDSKKLDATDGLAAALCHYFISCSPIQQATTKHKKTKKTSWESYLADNPNKIIK